MRSKKKGTLAEVVPLRPVAKAAKKTPKRPAKPLPSVDADVAHRALLEMSRHLTDNAGPTEALRSHLQTIHTLLKPKVCYVARYFPSREQLHVEHVRGRYDDRVTAAVPGEGVVGRAFSQKALLRDGDTIAVPLEGPQGVGGVLVVLGSRREPSDTLLQSLAAQLTAAYEVARLRDDSARRNKDLQTAIAGLKSLEQNREELLGNVSHDLKNPLTTIKSYLAMMGREKLGALTDAQRRAVQICDRNSDRMLRMVNDLLLMSRLQSGKMQLNQRPFGLKAVAEEVVRSLGALAEHCKVRVVIPPCPEVFVRGDRERIAEAIHNLVENGIHHSEADDTVEVRVSAEDGLAMLTVKDSGPGMSSEALEHVFDAFYRATPGMPRPPGAGLGLPLVGKIVALHGGRMESASVLGEGSTFQMVLPMFAGAVSAPEMAQAAPKSGGILLVEDDADCREVLQQVLEQEGYRVMATSGASEARSILSHIRPAMVLLDLRLSEEDGQSVLRYIRGNESLADIVVYIISGASEVASLTSGQGLERIDGFFEKPLNLPKLLDTVSAVVRPSRRSPAVP
ncbi:ATP-binding response regulator [Myxococcus sp. NMCA1]|uniref:ATP-binding response regulator n=1 Tax=Myxococcus sp. NMCA1 TaxID=2996785 RepID=UPI0022854E91|nr:hybrid sensor histidine kinase/response regulator [Myxococcus sp. NMCA1]WAM29717.1 hybrid sensor histidine kinase/response regulator [Myxococcus sp. NMCA1]